jgi:hypothetical protein
MTSSDNVGFSEAVYFSHLEDHLDFASHLEKQIGHGELVYKMGSTTGLRIGKYHSLYTGEDFNDNRLSIVVEWDCGDHFADNGDCGSVYFYK